MLIAIFLNHKEHEVHKDVFRNYLSVILRVLRDLRGYYQSIHFKIEQNSYQLTTIQSARRLLYHFKYFKQIS